MIRPLELLIGLRYIRAKRRNHFISFISLTSIIGIAIGVWALITVLSIMNGFERELRERILSVASHVTVSGQNGWLNEQETVNREINKQTEILASAPFILGQGLLMGGRMVKGALIRGVLPAQEAGVSNLSENLKQGNWNALESGKWQIVLGSELARQLGVSVGQKVTLVAPKGQITPAGLLPRLKRFTVAGIFELGMYEHDSGLAILHLDDASRLFKTGASVSGLRLKLPDLYDAPRIRDQLSRALGETYRVTDWTIQHINLFRAIKIERRVMFIILLLIVAVAAFNIVSTLVMLVTDKRSDMAILRTLGLGPPRVMAIFMIQGTLIGLVGTLIGGVSGVITALNVETLVPWLESMFGVEFFPSSVYVITDFPAQLKWEDVYQIISISFVLSVVATLYPAWRAAKTDPAEVLRYE